MFQWMTLTIALAASIIFIANRLRHKKFLIFKLIIALAAESAALLLFALLELSGLFLSALLLGQVGCLVHDWLRCGHRFVFPELCLYLCADAVFLPLCFCGEEVWQYAVYLAVGVFCIAVTPVSEKYQTFSPVEFYPEKKGLYAAMSALPCAVLAPEFLLLFTFKAPTADSAMMLSGVFLLLFCLVLWLQQEVIRRLTAEEFNRAMSRWQRESRDYMNTIRSQRHDFNLHLHAISGLINSGEYEKCGEYINGLVSDANAVNDIMPVSDAVVGSMLYNMREEARRRGSDIVYRITYDMEDILCNGFECNKVIGNLLQNAIDALQTPEDKEYGIRLSIFKRRGNTVIISENRFTGDPDRIARVFEPGYSTKKEHDGIGLSMVLRTVESYGGRAYPEFDKDAIRFVVNIPNRVRLSENKE